MKQLIFLAAAAGGTFFALSPAHAVGTRYPFCIQGDEFPGLSNCTFASYEQCQATASGRYLACIENPFFNPGGASRGSRGRAAYSDRY